jgi:hypothetical protein
MLIILFENQQNAVPPASQQATDVQVQTPRRGVKAVFPVVPTEVATAVLLANPYRKGARLHNAHATAVTYLGRDASVTTTTGMPLAAGTAIEDAASVDPWYAIMGTGVTGDLRVIEYQ